MTLHYEAEFADGLYDIAHAEIDTLVGKQGRIFKRKHSDAIAFSYDGNWQDLLSLTTVIAVYSVQQFAIPRPKALLGHENFHNLLDQLNVVRDRRFESLYLSAAGSDSSVMMRIKDELASTTGLSVAADEGDLLLRLRPTPNATRSWDALVRLTPRPLGTRDYRVCNMQGALNASVAAAMVRLSRPTADDRFLNIACGSGTILIERARYGHAASLIGCDIDTDALACARQNIAASDVRAVQMLHTDGMTLPLPDSSVNRLAADLPFGQLVGSHDENEWLYPAILAEAARVAASDARFVVITHEVRLMDDVIASQAAWRLVHKQMITLSGLHPRIFVLAKTRGLRTSCQNHAFHPLP